ncbi:YrhK family protein [Pontivivens insulae]|uniref:YrhK domain-containing protein n=1 Tax=Pontivivens insulae TaxID=1639689 RepID=A0A2R8AAZ8_9RHOB|nr:YrhK family protein [Pontivivens insulae]RED13320.1 YrhK-like protein [Pontivivens insulae]SPF29412.1 hypothetical protein POI8812_01720 [Pontivivens insulae]
MIFEADRRGLSHRHRRLHAAFELAMTVANFLAALLFVIGSVCFFSEDWLYLGTWLFVIGSALFMVSPALNVIRELRLAAMGDVDDLANRFEDGS